MRRPRPVRPFRAADLLVPATACAAVAASAVLVFVTGAWQAPADRAAPMRGATAGRDAPATPPQGTWQPARAPHEWRTR